MNLQQAGIYIDIHSKIWLKSCETFYNGSVK